MLISTSERLRFIYKVATLVIIFGTQSYILLWEHYVILHWIIPKFFKLVKINAQPKEKKWKQSIWAAFFDLRTRDMLKTWSNQLVQPHLHTDVTLHNGSTICLKVKNSWFKMMLVTLGSTMHLGKLETLQISTLEWFDSTLTRAKKSIKSLNRQSLLQSGSTIHPKYYKVQENDTSTEINKKFNVFRNFFKKSNKFWKI